MARRSACLQRWQFRMSRAMEGQARPLPPLLPLEEGSAVCRALAAGQQVLEKDAPEEGLPRRHGRPKVHSLQRSRWLRRVCLRGREGLPAPGCMVWVSSGACAL